MPKENHTNKTEKPIVLFDGMCSLCNGTVQFIIRRDKDRLFTFTALQSDHGRRLLEQYAVSGANLDSIVLLTATAVHIKSDAVLKIASLLPFPWRLFSPLRILPHSMRDALYDLIAHNRHLCRLPNS